MEPVPACNLPAATPRFPIGKPTNQARRIARSPQRQPTVPSLTCAGQRCRRPAPPCPPRAGCRWHSWCTPCPAAAPAPPGTGRGLPEGPTTAACCRRSKRGRGRGREGAKQAGAAQGKRVGGCAGTACSGLPWPASCPHNHRHNRQPQLTANSPAPVPAAADQQPPAGQPLHALDRGVVLPQYRLLPAKKVIPAPGRQ